MSLPIAKCYVCKLYEKNDAMLGDIITKTDIEGTGIDLSFHYYCLLSSNHIPQKGKN